MVYSVGWSHGTGAEGHTRGEKYTPRVSYWVGHCRRQVGLHPDGAIQGAYSIPWQSRLITTDGQPLVLLWWVCDLETAEFPSVQMSPRWPGKRRGLTEKLWGYLISGFYIFFLGLCICFGVKREIMTIVLWTTWLLVDRLAACDNYLPPTSPPAPLPGFPFHSRRVEILVSTPLLLLLHLLHWDGHFSYSFWKRQMEEVIVFMIYMPR